MRTLKLTLEYDGTELSGWQRQDNAPTVQEHLEDSLAELFGEPTQATGASRTDAGVHAFGQAVSVRTTRDIPTNGIRKALNSSLPSAIAVRSVEEVPPEFHARFSARGKHYRYRVLNREVRDPSRGRYTWHVARTLDLEAMSQAGAKLVGEFDFSAFRASGCTAKHAVRRITDVKVARQDDEIVIHVRGNAFLRNMVRIVAGTLVEVGWGRFTPQQVAEILEARDRTRGGQTAPAGGLALMRVYYDDSALMSDT